MTDHLEMMTIWKSPLQAVHHELRKGARILNIDRDPNGETCLWALVDVNAEVETWETRLYGTGWFNVPTEGYVGMFLDGPMVWHVFAKPLSPFKTTAAP